MRRRALLGLVGASAVGLAGCTGEAPGGGTTDSPEPTDTPTGTPTGTAEPEPEPIVLTDRSFEVTDQACGEGRSEATVSHEPLDGQAGRVVVDGVVTGRDSCYSARLADVAVEQGDEQTLRIAVEPYVPAENQGKGCADCIVDVAYQSTVSYEGAGPFTVVVEHEGERVAEGGPYGGAGEGTPTGTVSYRTRPIR